jgi:AAA15 family ATPase/GTPase
MINTVDLINFKCFKHLHVENLQRVNLIGGKNNIGKTSFLEGLEILVKSKSGFGLRIVTSDIIRRRQAKKNINPHQPQQLQEFELDVFNDIRLNTLFTSDNLKAEVRYIPAGGVLEANNIQFFNPQTMQTFGHDSNRAVPIPYLEFSLYADKFAASVQEIVTTIFQTQDINHVSNNVNFISSCTTDESVISVYYGKLININKEEYVNESLRLFDGNFLSLKPVPVTGGTVLKLQIRNRETAILLSSLGEGINRYIAILCAIWASQDGYLFIDEIENGIHYTNYPKLWTVIFEASKMANCQIFITTHSKECVEAFNEINSENDGAYFEFYRSKKTDQINVKQRDKEQLEYSLSHNGEFRGE